jgi:hypothetical protein
MSAAVRADLLEDSDNVQENGDFLLLGHGGGSKQQLCQDGATQKVISVILGCSSRTHSDLEMRSTCSEEDVDFPKGKRISTPPCHSKNQTGQF